MTTTVEELYGDFWGRVDPEFQEAFGTSLKPRGADMLYDVFAGFGVGTDDTVLDAGCRDAIYAVELVRRFGCRAVAIDPVPLHIERAHRRVAEAGLADRITVHQARMEDMPIESGSIAAIWCRDVLNHVNLPASLAECHRVLVPGGRMLVYQTFATDKMELREAARLYTALAMVPENMSPTTFEGTARQVGFVIEQRDPIDSEWRERWIEDGDHQMLEDLLQVARMRRREEDLVQRFGRERYEAELAGAVWGIYQMLGKLCPTVYVLRKPGE